MDQQPPLTDAHRVPRANPRHRNDRVFTENDILLAWRNVGMPMESLVCDTTPPGLHYTLHHFDIPFLDGAHTCQITGLCSDSVLTLESLKQMANEGAKREIMVTLECAGNGRSGMNPRPAQNVPWQIHGVGTARWGGVPLLHVLKEVDTRCKFVIFTGADSGTQGTPALVQYYQRALSWSDIDENVIIAFEMNGQPLPPQHGFPFRLVVPRTYGMKSVKWLKRIELSEAMPELYQHKAYRTTMHPAPGSDVIERGPEVHDRHVRSLMAPPGIPDFSSRVRLLQQGSHTIRGRAWSGGRPIREVQFSGDDGNTWVQCALAAEGDEQHRFAWTAWSVKWDATPGEHVLVVRASDDIEQQPMEPISNQEGLCNNAVQRVRVIVEGGEQLRDYYVQQ